MIDFRLYLISDRRQCPGDDLAQMIDVVCSAGVRAVQIREKDMETRPLFDLATSIRERTRAHKAKLFINDRLDVAAAVGADGVHCPENGFAPSAVKHITNGKTLVGASVHSLKQAWRMEKDGADFVTFGPVFATRSKEAFGEPQGLAALRAVAEELRIPVFAIGGINPERAADCLANGAAGVALISSILAAEDPAAVVGQFESVLGAL